jgi:hypothetical protein
MTFPSTRAPSPDMSDYPIGKPPMTPRERDPLVWAAAFGAAFVSTFEAVYRAICGPHEVRQAAAREQATEEATALADAAALAARPEPPTSTVTLTSGHTLKRTMRGHVVAVPITADPPPPGEHLAALEEAERAYLLAAGWRVARAPDRWIAEDDSVWPIESALRVQRDRDAGR